jgi:predicted DNA-binding transcriptional regulator AlpA
MPQCVRQELSIATHLRVPPRDPIAAVTDVKSRIAFKALVDLTELSRWTIMRRVKDHTFPPPLSNLTRRFWMAHDVRRWFAYEGRTAWEPWVPPHQ